MANIYNVLRYVDDVKPNRFEDATKVQWLNEVEGYIQTEVMMLALADVVQYDPEKDMYTELLVKPPHDKLYSMYLCALVDFANGEYDKYNNTMQMYNKFLGEYIKWYTRVFHPADGGCVREGYYLSAYLIATRHGFEGTEEEWVASLKGERGEPFEYEDFTPEQLEALTGPMGPAPQKGVDYWTDADKEELREETEEMISAERSAALEAIASAESDSIGRLNAAADELTETAKQDIRQDVETAGNEKIAEIGSAGDENVQAVRDEGAAQVAAVRDAAENSMERAETAAGTAETARTDAQSAAQVAVNASDITKEAASDAGAAANTAVDAANTAKSEADRAEAALVLYKPVDKTDAMTAEVGRDEDGRLWTAGTGRGVKTLSIRRTEQGIEFGVTLEDGTKLAAFAPMSDVRIENTAPTAETPGAEGELLFDTNSEVLYVCRGLWMPAFGEPGYLWTAVGGGSGLPEHTAADEGKVLRIKDGKAVWTDNLDCDVHAVYFMITREGLLSLKPEYRGANTRSEYPYANSDNGLGVAGSRNAELPERLIIPKTVNGTAVNRLADGIFLSNHAVKDVTFPSCVEDIPERCFDNAYNLHNLYNTDHVKSVGKTAFQSSSIYRVEFPNLETFGGVSAFQNCGRLVYADIGGVKSLPDKTFNSCVSLSRVKSQKKITSVGEKAFSITGNLMNLDFVSDLTNIGSAAFLSTRFDYDWNSLTGCTFGTDATQKQFNPTDFWSTCTYTACENPLPTQLTQDNPLWAKRGIGSSGVTYAEGCGFFSIMHAYCGLHDISADSVEELENIVNTNYPGHLDTYTKSVNNAKFFAQGLGLTTETYKQFDQTVLQTVYDALANGKYALVGLSGTSYSLSHFVLIYGINDYGELLVIDSAGRYKDDMSKAAHLTIPYKNLCGYKYGTVDVITILSL